VTWPLPELDAGVELGELSPLDDELPEVPEPDELDDVPELDEACRALLAAEPEDVLAVEAVAPGRVNAIPPAAIRLAAAAVTVAARSRARPRSLTAAPDAMPCMCWLMAPSVTGGSRWPLCAGSQPAMSAARTAEPLRAGSSARAASGRHAPPCRRVPTRTR
jgi:hypothetical protein